MSIDDGYSDYVTYKGLMALVITGAFANTLSTEGFDYFGWLGLIISIVFLLLLNWWAFAKEASE